MSRKRGRRWYGVADSGVQVDLDAKTVKVFVACDSMMDGLVMIPTLVDALKVGCRV